jgi:hypothetical protein
MRPLTLADLLSPQEFLARREAVRRDIIALKALRRVAVGPYASLVFENRTTLLWQVHEMCRVEELTADAARQKELDVYNELMPPEGGLSATMFLEFDSEALLKTWLSRLAGIEEHVLLRPGPRTVRARFEAGRSREAYTASVHYLQFSFVAEDRRAFAEAQDVRVEIDHPAYRHAATLPPAARASLLDDLRSP